MEQSHSWDSDNLSPGQEGPSLLWNPKEIYCRGHNNLKIIINNDDDDDKPKRNPNGWFLTSTYTDLVVLIQAAPWFYVVSRKVLYSVRFVAFAAQVIEALRSKGVLSSS